MGLSQVLAALEVERFRKAALTAAQLNGDTTAGGDIAQTTAATLDTLQAQTAAKSLVVVLAFEVGVLSVRTGYSLHSAKHRCSI
jgi:hypothetical protein